MACEGLIRLRRATVDDAYEIAVVHVNSWREAYVGQVPAPFLEALSFERRESMWRSSLEVQSGDHRPWVAESDSGIVGFVSVGLSRDNDATTTTGEVYAIYVEPECWSRGIGRELLRHASRDLREHGFLVATLWVLASNERARRFYEWSNWHFEGKRRTETIGSAEVEEVRYRYDLR